MLINSEYFFRLKDDTLVKTCPCLCRKEDRENTVMMSKVSNNKVAFGNHFVLWNIASCVGLHTICRQACSIVKFVRNGTCRYLLSLFSVPLIGCLT